jgi:predicted dehydrogenase
MQKKKVGLIGCGFISGDHLSGWKNNKHAEVVAVCDIKKERVEKRAEEFGIERAYRDYREMLGNEDMDIVDIVTPVSTHKELVLESVKKAVDILIEKPFADRMEDAVEMVSACEKNRVKLMVCQTYRWHPWYQQIKRELQSGIIGRPYYANIMQRVSFAIPQGPEGKIPLLEDQPFYEDVELLLLLEQGCHYLDAFRYFCGEAKSVTAAIRYISPYVRGDDLALVIVNFSDMVAVLEDLWCTVGQQKTSVTFIQGEKGSIFFDGTGGAAPHRTEDTGNLQIVLSSGEKIERELDGTKYYAKGFEKLIGHFVDCILNDEEPITSGRDNLKTLAIAFKAYEASRQQRTLSIEE